MKKKFSIFRGCACIGIALSIVSVSTLGVANSYRTDIDTFLNTSSYKSAAGDSYTYEASYNMDELIQAHKDLGERLLEEGSVLLKNEGDALPIQTDDEKSKVTLFGMRSYMSQFGGTVNATPNLPQNVQMNTAFDERGFECNPKMVEFYQEKAEEYAPGLAQGVNNEMSAKGTTVNEVPTKVYNEAPNNYSDYKDAAIIVLGRDCTEANDYYPGAQGIANKKEFDQSTTGNIIGLSNDEKDLITYVKNQGVFDRIIVLINATTTMEIQELKDDEAIDAILWIGTPGNYGFYGVADVLNGTASPSGHLPDTYAVNTAMSPAAQNMGVYTYANANEIDPTFTSSRDLRNSWYVAETEGIYIGYKYYETRYFDSIVNPSSGAASTSGSSYPEMEWNYDNEVTYPFGYGLSYSTFTEEIVSSDIHLDGESKVEVKVTNTGSVAAKHAVQLYVAQPYSSGQVEKSAIQLVGYEKTGDKQEAEENRPITDSVLLNPNESEVVTITFDGSMFASYDEKEGDGAYIFDEGNYYFAIGNGAHEALQNVMRAQGVLDGSADTNVITFGNESKIVMDKTAGGSEIHNQLQDMNLNNLGNEVTYLTRSNWGDSFPVELNEVKATDQMEEALQDAFYNSADYDVSEIATHKFGVTGTNGENMLAAAKGNEDFNDEIYEKILEGVPLATMVQGTAVAFQRILAIPEINSPEVRSMGGIVGPIARLGRYNSEDSKYYLSTDDANAKYNTNTFCTEPVVAATFSHRAASLQGDVFGNDVLWTGMIWWYGVGMNIHRTPYNARNNEYYSEDSVLTGIMAKDVVANVTKYGAITGIKHFAFNDQESNREGLSVFMSEQQARENELRGFQIAIEDGNVGSVMTAYNRAGCTYSSAHKGLISGVLRGEWGYNNIVITDMIHGGEKYMLPKESLAAGTDMIMSSTNAWSDFNEKDLEKDPVMLDALNESWHHVLYTVANSSAMNGFNDNSEVDRVYPWWEIALIATVAVSSILTVILSGLAILAAGLRKKTHGGVE